MSQPRFRSLLGFAAFLGFLPCAHAFTLSQGGFTVNGNAVTVTTIGWKTSQLTFDLDASCASYTDLVTTSVGLALDLWNGAPSTDLKISLGGTTQLPQTIGSYIGTGSSSAAPAGNPIIACDTNFAANTGLSSASIPGLAGAMNMIYPTGQLQGGILLLNVEPGAAANIATMSPALAAVVLSHEVGHILGLGHSADPNALMYFATGEGRQVVLSPDDLEGITYLYPRAEPGNGKFFGCGSITTDNPGSGGGGNLPSVLEFSGLLLSCLTIWWLAKLKRGERSRVPSAA